MAQYDGVSVMEQPTFNIFEALSAWGNTLPGWQYLLLSKLVATEDLSDDVLEEVFTEFLIDQDLAGSDAVRVNLDMELPQFQANGPTVVSKLTAMVSVSGVNALTAGETLSFGPKLTVVYGPNGAGKSGYARVLKSACFTRSKDTGILGDVKLAKNRQPKPTATFTFDDGSSEVFVHQDHCQRLREGFAVFDSTCVRVHLDDRNAFQVMPYLFDVFPRMVAAFGKLQSKLREEITRRTPVVDKFSIQDSTSEVATMLANLTAQTNLVRMKELAMFGDIEAARLLAIEQQLVELRTTDPKEVIKKNEQRITDMNAIKGSITALKSSIKPVDVANIRETITQIRVLSERGSALSAAQFGGEPVQPVGTRAWRDLLAAAIDFNKEAYPEDTFPATVEKARCVLCHQILDEVSVNRLTRFYQMATNDIETELAVARQKLLGCSEALGKVGLAFFAEESAVRRTLRELDSALEADIAAHIGGYQFIVESLARVIADESDPGFSILEYDSVSDRLSALAERLRQDNEKLRLADPAVPNYQSSFTVPRCSVDPNGVPYAGGSNIIGENDFTGANGQSIEDNTWSGKIELDYKPDEDTLIYASISRGTKAPGFNNGNIAVGLPAESLGFDSETITAYEIGYKSSFWDQRGRFATSAFYYDYSDFQALSFEGVGSFISNRDANLYGAEFELTMEPADGLTLQLNGGYTNSTLEDQPNTLNVVEDRDMALAPSWTMSWMARYEQPIMDESHILGFQLDGNARDAFYNNPDNDSAAEIENFRVVNGRIDLIAMDDKYRVSLTGKNLMDDEFRTSTFMIFDFGLRYSYWNQPRTWGLEFSTNFN
jgi:adenylate kinase family enzyme